LSTIDEKPEFFKTIKQFSTIWTEAKEKINQEREIEKQRIKQEERIKQKEKDLLMRQKVKEQKNDGRGEIGKREDKLRSGQFVRKTKKRKDFDDFDDEDSVLQNKDIYSKIL
jgi:hypothetical protein